jgi:TolB-like protein/class 3 adenylate cyclase
LATAQVDRRLAVILAADVANYCRLMERDEAGTVARLKAIRKELVEPVLARHGGRFVDLKGDGAIIEFGSAVAAVEAAVEIQRAMAQREADRREAEQIRYRIGINPSEVIVDGANIYGDGVNRAARIEGLCEPGGVWLSRGVHDLVRGKLDVPFEPTGRHRVKNISEPVETWRVRFEDGPAWRRGMRRVRPGWLAAAAAAVLLGLVATGGAWWRWPEQAAAGKPGIAVLPLENLGGDEATGRLADGLTEDIIADFACFRDLDVIARNSTDVYKGKPVDVRQVGKDLGVGYVLEGSIQRQADRVRVTAKLIDAHSGAHVWSERWDRPAADVFAVQGEVAEQVAAQLGGGLSEAMITTNEARRAKRRAPRDQDLTTYDHYVLAADAKAVRTEQAVVSGLEHAERAIARDPTFARAYTVRGLLRYITLGFGADWTSVIEQAGADYRKAVELDPTDAEAHAQLGFWYTEKGQMAETVAEVERALELCPANIHVLVEAASALPYAGRVEAAVAAADKAARLDPRMSPITRATLKDAYFFARQFGRTVELVAPIPEESRSRFSRLALAASYVYLGRREEAETAKKLFIARHGEPSAELWLNHGFAFAREQERELFVNSFRELGLPVCATPQDLARISSLKHLPECSKVEG